MTRSTNILVLAFIAIFFFLQYTDAAPAAEANVEKRWNDPSYYCCYYYYQSGKRGLDKRWENKCEEYPTWDKRDLDKRVEDMEKRWDNQYDYYCCYYYGKQNKRSLGERWDQKCKIYEYDPKTKRDH